MPIKFSCSQCGSSLRVPDEHIGKQARCPKCSETNLVPSTSEPDDGSESERSDIGSVSSKAAAAIPLATPPAPPSSTPMASESPYASPMAPAKSDHVAGSERELWRPIYDARTMMTWFGWSAILLGVLSCLTIFGAIVGWVYIWLGILGKGAAQAVTIGYEQNNVQQLHAASQKLGTFFKVLGVLAIIMLCFFALYILFVFVAIFLGIVSAASGM